MAYNDLERGRTYNRERQAYGRRIGRCASCLEPTAPGETRCPQHVKANQDGAANRYAMRVVEGLCVKCKEPTSNGSRCVDCAAEAAEVQKRYRQRKSLATA